MLNLPPPVKPGLFRPYWRWCIAAIVAMVGLRALSLGASCIMDKSLTCGDWFYYGFFGPLRFKWVQTYKEIIAAVIAATAALLAVRPLIAQMLAARVQAAAAAIETLENEKAKVADSIATLEKFQPRPRGVLTALTRLETGQTLEKRELENLITSFTTLRDEIKQIQRRAHPVDPDQDHGCLTDFIADGLKIIDEISDALDVQSWNEFRTQRQHNPAHAKILAARLTKIRSTIIRAGRNSYNGIPALRALEDRYARSIEEQRRFMIVH